MKSKTFWILIFLTTLLSFQKPTPVQTLRPLAQAYGGLLDSMKKFKYPTFEEGLVRANFLIDLSASQRDWETHFKALNLKVILAEYHQKLGLIEPFIKDLEQRLASMSLTDFPKYPFFKSQIKQRWSEMYDMLHQPFGVIKINKEIIEGIQNGTLLFEDKPKTLVTAYYDLGSWMSELGQVTEGIDYLLLSKKYSDADPKRKLDFAIIVNGQLSKKYLSLGKNSEAFYFNLSALKIAQELYEKEGFTQQNIGFFTANYRAISQYYLKIDKPDSALFYLNKITLLPYEQDKVENNLLKAKCFTLLKKWDKAEKILNDASVLLDNKLETYLLHKPQLFQQLARIKHQQKQQTAALHYCQKALAALDPQMDTSRVESNPTVSRVLMKKEMLEVLQLKSNILYDMAQQSAAYIEPCYQTALLTALMVDTIRSDYSADFDKQYLAQVSYPIYETALQIGYWLFEKTHNDKYLTDALNIIERSKATVLLNNLQKGQAETDFSEQDREKLYEWRQSLIKLDRQIFDLTVKNTPFADTALQNLQTQRAILNRQYDEHIGNLKTKYPQYAAVKFGIQTLSVADIRHDLPKEGVYIAYFVGENNIYTLSIDYKTAQIFKTDNPQKLTQLVETIRQSIRPSSRDDDQTDIQNYCTSASELYDWLLKGPLSISSDKKTNIVVSPDGALNFIPFDILLTEKAPSNPHYRTLPYLLRQANTSFAPSVTVWQQQKNIQHNRAPQLFVGFAPQYQITKTSDWADMPNARHEIAEIAKQMTSAKTYIGDMATEENFVKNAPNYCIIHLSMHAEYNATNPAFSQFVFTQNDTTPNHNRLFLNELQNQKLNADLVVLSACETGYGTLNRGEGVMSLARTFMSIGVPSSVMSLWKIPSDATENVLSKFYVYLNQNQTVGTSLRQAKLDYLQNQSLNSPYYWSGLVPIGDAECQPISSPVRQWWGFVSLLVLGLGGGILYAKRRQKE
jgi:CHAT domain-containing protein